MVMQEANTVNISLDQLGILFGIVVGVVNTALYILERARRKSRIVIAQEYACLNPAYGAILEASPASGAEVLQNSYATFLVSIYNPSSLPIVIKEIEVRNKSEKSIRYGSASFIGDCVFAEDEEEIKERIITTPITISPYGYISGYCLINVSTDRPDKNYINDKIYGSGEIIVTTPKKQFKKDVDLLERAYC